MSILIFLGIPILIWAVIMLLSLREVVAPEETRPTEIKPADPKPTIQAQPNLESTLPFSRDYTGRVWVDRKQKGAMPKIRRRGVTPPNELEE